MLAHFQNGSCPSRSALFLGLQYLFYAFQLSLSLPSSLERSRKVPTSLNRKQVSNKTLLKLYILQYPQTSIQRHLAQAISTMVFCECDLLILRTSVHIINYLPSQDQYLNHMTTPNIYILPLLFHLFFLLCILHNSPSCKRGKFKFPNKDYHS